MTDNPTSFAELGLAAHILEAVQDLGYTTPSPIQAQAIPILLEGHDLFGQSQTGTGKTAAFGLPLLQNLNLQETTVQALVMCPTRELAVQVAGEFEKMGKYMRGLRIATVYGGDSIERQIKFLQRGAHVVVGTPGRLIDHLERRTLKLDAVATVVLDEADEMLDMGFREDIELILHKTPDSRQTVLFSATMSPEILALTKEYQFEPQQVKIARTELTTPNIRQLYVQVKNKYKSQALMRLVQYYDMKRLLVFCNTKRGVDELVEEVIMAGGTAEGLHGDMRQNARNTVMARFRSGQLQMLVATDVAARGIDVDNVDGVINYDVPMDEEYYVHRIGRTGRAGRKGISITFVGGRDFGRLKDIMRYTKAQMEVATVPSLAELWAHRQANVVEELQALSLNTVEVGQHHDLAERLIAEHPDTVNLVATLLQTWIGNPPDLTQDRDLNEQDRKESRYDRADDRGGRKGKWGREDRFDRGGDRGDRGDRGYGRKFDAPQGRSFTDRGPRPSRDAARTDSEPMTRLFVSIGHNDRVRPGDIVGAIAGEAQLPGSRIGHISIHDGHTFVDVPSAQAESVIRSMNNNQIKGKKVRVNLANA